MSWHYLYFLVKAWPRSDYFTDITKIAVEINQSLVNVGRQYERSLYVFTFVHLGISNTRNILPTKKWQKTYLIWVKWEILKKLRIKNGGCLCCVMLRSAELSKSFGLRYLCYSKTSVVMLLGYRIAWISRNLESERKINALCPNAAYLNS